MKKKNICISFYKTFKRGRRGVVVNNTLVHRYPLLLVTLDRTCLHNLHRALQLLDLVLHLPVLPPHPLQLGQGQLLLLALLLPRLPHRLVVSRPLLRVACAPLCPRLPHHEDEIFFFSCLLFVFIRFSEYLLLHFILRESIETENRFETDSIANEPSLQT